MLHPISEILEIGDGYRLSLNSSNSSEVIKIKLKPKQSILNQASSRVIKGHQGSLSIIKCHQASSSFIKCLQSFQLQKRLYIHKCLFIRSSVCQEAKPLNSLKSSSFILHHSSIIIHPSSFFIHHSSLTLHHSLFTIHHSSFIPPSFCNF